jgi:hypothetical protein
MPARYATPFAVERDHPSLRISELYRSYERFPLHGYLQLRLCSGDPATREGLLASLRTLPEREPGRPLYHGATWLRTAHDTLLRSCDTRDHCYWVLEAAESEPAHPGRDLLWEQFARCAMPSDAPRFESTKAPIDSLVRYYEGRRAPPNQYSPRLEAWVRQLVQTNQLEPLRAALLAYRNIDLPRTGETLIDLASQAGSLEMRFAIGWALRQLSHPEARKLAEQIASEERAWRAELCQKRGLHCEIPDSVIHESGPRGWAAPSFAPEPWELDPSRRRFSALRSSGWYEDEESRLLRDLIVFLRPELDGVVVEERWPAMDRLAIAPGAVPIQVFVNGDASILPLPPPRNDVPPEFDESFRLQVEEALHQERIIDAYLNGERFSVSFSPEPDRLAAVELVSLANALLEAADRPSRLRILSLGESLEVERQSIR